MMHKRMSWLGAFLMMLLLPIVAQAHHHESHMEGMHAAETTQQCATPAPACSMTVTTAADQQGTLWRAFVNHHTLYGGGR